MTVFQNGTAPHLASAFRKITARNLSIIPVVDGERLVGIVTLQNLMHSMGMLAESRKLAAPNGRAGRGGLAAA